MPLTSKERALAFFIFQHINQNLERAVLQEQVFRLNPRVQTRTVDTHNSRLRTKLNLNNARGFVFGRFTARIAVLNILQSKVSTNLDLSW